MKLEELKVYNSSMELGEKVWNIVDKWNYFTKDTVGKQLVRAADSESIDFIGKMFTATLNLSE